METSTIVTLLAAAGAVVLFLLFLVERKRVKVFRSALEKSHKLATKLMTNIEQCRKEKDNAWSLLHNARKCKKAGAASLALFEVVTVHFGHLDRQELIVEAGSKEEVYRWLEPWNSARSSVLKETSLEGSPFGACDPGSCEGKHIFYVTSVVPNGALVKTPNGDLHYAPRLSKVAA